MSQAAGGRRLAVRFDGRVWQQAIRGFSGRALEVATSARGLLERDGIGVSELLPCEPLGPDRTELSGCAKLYLPVHDAPPSERAFAFVVQLARGVEGEPVLVFIAFGPRHPGRGVRSVYERAHRQLHGRFPT